MAKVIKKPTQKSSKKILSPFYIYWDKTNYILLITGLVLLVIGFYLMSVGPWDSTASLVFSPIVLFIAYVLIFPAAILYRNKNKSKDDLTNTQ